MAEKEGLPKTAHRLFCPCGLRASGARCQMLRIWSNLRFSSPLRNPNKKGALWAPFCLDGGEGGIRTLDTLLTYTPLAGERLQPLGHFSKFSLLRLFLLCFLPSPVARYSVLRTSPSGSPSCRRRSLAVLDCSISHWAPSPNFRSFTRRWRLLQPLPQCD